MVDLNREDIINAIKGSGGIIDHIRKKLNINWHTARKIIDENEEYQTLLRDEIEINIDIAESNIHNDIRLGDIQTSKWYLSTIGKNRGYSEKKEVEHSGGIEQRFSQEQIKEEIDKLIMLRKKDQ